MEREPVLEMGAAREGERERRKTHERERSSGREDE